MAGQPRQGQHQQVIRPANIMDDHDGPLRRAVLLLGARFSEAAAHVLSDIDCKL